jgi:putative zinc finger protein
MDHSEAVRIKAAEQYLLGELTGDEREQYEEHFFGCQQCAMEVTGGAAFLANTKEVYSAEKDFVPARSTPAPGWFAVFLRPAFAVPALALLALVVTYQSAIVIPHLKDSLARATAPQAIPSYSLITQNSRGGNPVTIHAPSNTPFSIFLDIPPGKQFLFYNCELQTESGKVEFALHVPAEEARDTVQLLIPASRLHPGNHILVIRGSGSAQGSGAAEDEVARYAFTLDYVK